MVSMNQHRMQILTLPLINRELSFQIRTQKAMGVFVTLTVLLSTFFDLIEIKKCGNSSAFVNCVLNTIIQIKMEC